MLELSGRRVPFAPRTNMGGEFTNKLVEIGDAELAAEGETGRTQGQKAPGTGSRHGRRRPRDDGITSLKDLRLTRDPSEQCSSSVLQQLGPLIRARGAERNRDSHDCDRERAPQ